MARAHGASMVMRQSMRLLGVSQSEVPYVLHSLGAFLIVFVLSVLFAAVAAVVPVVGRYCGHGGSRRCPSVTASWHHGTVVLRSASQCDTVIAVPTVVVVAMATQRRRSATRRCVLAFITAVLVAQRGRLGTGDGRLLRACV